MRETKQRGERETTEAVSEVARVVNIVVKLSPITAPLVKAQRGICVHMCTHGNFNVILGRYIVIVYTS